MVEREALGEAPVSQVRLSMLREVYEAALDAAGDIWPTPAMAMGRLFERAVVFLENGAALDPVRGRADPDLLASLNVLREDLLLVEALYLLTRQVTYLLTEQSAALEATWLRLADRHLEIRGEIVAQRRREEELKRELTALGGAAVPLPEHDDLPPVSGDRPRKSRGMFEQLFEGVSVVEADLHVAAPFLPRAEQVAQARGWVEDWGEQAPLAILTHGISLARRERETDVVDGDDDESVKAAQQSARSRLMGLEGRYSTLRRRLFELRHNNRILQWRITALEVEAQGMRSRLDQFLTDRDRLEVAIGERRAAGATIQPAAPPPEPRVSWLQRLGRLFGGS